MGDVVVPSTLGTGVPDARLLCGSYNTLDAAEELLGGGFGGVREAQCSASAQQCELRDRSLTG